MNLVKCFSSWYLLKKLLNKIYTYNIMFIGFYKKNVYKENQQNNMNI